MADRLSPEARSRLMASVRGKDTKPEMVVRRLSHAFGYRFRLHRQDLPGTPDLVFPRLGLVLFVHGCFFHRHEGCRLTTTPVSNWDFWQRKFMANVKRDRRVSAQLRALGWRVNIVWECETKNPEVLRQRLSLMLRRAAARALSKQALSQR